MDALGDNRPIHIFIFDLNDIIIFSTSYSRNCINYDGLLSNFVNLPYHFCTTVSGYSSNIENLHHHAAAPSLQHTSD